MHNQITIHRMADFEHDLGEEAAKVFVDAYGLVQIRKHGDLSPVL